ncbi:MAG: hypothetical protein ACK5LN_09655 [Propioniciclava sp.]
MTLLETAVNSSLTLTIGLIAFGALVLMLAITVGFGSARPHSKSK